jgi:hypothetical protein
VGADGRVRHTAGVPRIVKFGVIPFLLLVAAGGVASLVLGGGDGGSPEAQVIERLIPGEQEQVLRQAEVGIDLLTGWDATLAIEGVEIPDGQLDRIEDLGQVRFLPGPGKVFETLPEQPNVCATATYWQRATGPDQSFTRTWCFTTL